MPKTAPANTAYYAAFPEILSHMPEGEHVLVEASAGTGKTYAIEHLVAQLVLVREVPLEKILILTYTEKAAGELRQRVRSLLERLRELPAGKKPKEDSWTIDEEGRRRLESALFSFDSASIGTIHSFYMSVLLENALGLGRLLRQTIGDARGLFGRAFKNTLRRQFARKPEHQPYLEAWLELGEDVDSLEGFLFDCHKERAPLRPILDIAALRSFLNEHPLFAEEDGWREGFARRLKVAKVNAGRAKAVVARLSRIREALLSQRSAWSEVAYVQVDLKEPLQYLTEAAELLPPDLAVEIQALLASLRRHQHSLKAALAQRFLPLVQRELEEEKLARGEYDFDDMIAAVSAAIDGPEGAELVARLRQRFSHALVDEFQDTDAAQWNVLRRVFLESAEGSTLYLVGDPKQAIYGFRGADVFTYLSAKRTLESHAHGFKAVLQKNHRSTQQMIDAYNQVLKQDVSDPFFPGEIKYEFPVVCGNLGLSLSCKSRRDSGASLHLVRVLADEKIGTGYARERLGRFMAKEIQALLLPSNEYRFGVGEKAVSITPRDIFILTSTKTEGLEIGAYLRELHIPHAYYKQDGLFQTKEADDVYDLLTAVANPSDSSARLRAWLTPFFAVPLEELPRCLEIGEAEPLMAKLVAWHELAETGAFEELFARLLDESGLVRREILRTEGERALTNYKHIFELLLREVGQSVGTLADLVRRLAALIDERESPIGEDGNVQRLESERNAVQIMTMHKSKGLEAVVVFVFGGLALGPKAMGDLQVVHEGEDRLRVLHVGPGVEAKEQAKAERDEENRRLLYVAMTRAKGRLYLPLLPRNQQKSTWDGCYIPLNNRLADMAVELETSPSSLFEIHDIPYQPNPTWKPPPKPRLDNWRPDPALLRDVNDDAEFRQLRAQHAALEVTSYTRMKKKHGGYQAPIEAGEFNSAGRDAGAWLPEGSLPGGVGTGNFLHEVLELMPLDSFPAPFEEWSASEEVQDLFRRSAYKHGLDLEHLSEAQALVYRALSSPFSLGEAPVCALYSCQPCERELEFHYPFPEEAHPRLSESAAGRLVIGKGYIKGYIDLLFQHEGRVYCADWKSDILPDYGAVRLREHVEKNYGVQIKLYALALAKMLNVHDEADYTQRFGGMLYCFLRGVAFEGTPGAGFCFHRPSWNSLLGYESQLRAGKDLTEGPP